MVLIYTQLIFDILRNIALVFFNVVGNVSKVARSDALVPLHMFGVVKYIVWLCIW